MNYKKILILAGIFFACILLFILFFPSQEDRFLDESKTEEYSGFLWEESVDVDDFSFSFNEKYGSEELYESYDDFSHIEELHWGKMPIGYYIENPEVCGVKIVEQIRVAFETIQNLTEESVSFEKKTGSGQNTILLECFHRYGENVDVSFRAGNTYAYAKITYVFNDERENVIYNGEIKLHRITPGSYYGRCGEKPVTIIHEILHLFGFDDNGKADSIMYRYIGGCPDIDERIIKELKETYAK